MASSVSLRPPGTRSCSTGAARASELSRGQIRCQSYFATSEVAERGVTGALAAAAEPLNSGAMPHFTG